MWQRILSIVFPIFFVVMVGYVIGRRQRPDLSTANRLNMEVFLPALVFSGLVSKSFDLADHMPLALGCAAVVIGSGLLAWPFARWLHCHPRTLLAPVMFNNVGNMGLPLMLLTFGDGALGGAIVLMLVMTLLQFSIGTWLLSGRLHLDMLWRQPALVVAFLGVGLSLSGVSLWPPLTTGIKFLADISLGLMIFSLGVRLATAQLGALGIGVAGAILTPVTGMLAAGAVVLALPMSRADQDILFLFGALPPAVSNFIFAEQFGRDPDKVASMVLIGNAAAVLFIPLALALRL